MLLLLAAAAMAVQTLPPPAEPLSKRLSDPAVVRQAVRAALLNDRPPIGADITVLSATPNERFRAEMDDARVPGCLNEDGLKRQPTFFLGGILALPFIAIAKLRGKCN